jgi:uroporphyrinogen-III synthase
MSELNVIQPDPKRLKKIKSILVTQAAPTDAKSPYFDIEKKYVALAKARLKQPSNVREKQLRVQPVHAKDFVAGPSKGKTRHGAGLGARKK